MNQSNSSEYHKEVLTTLNKAKEKNKFQYSLNGNNSNKINISASKNNTINWSKQKSANEGNNDYQLSLQMNDPQQYLNFPMRVGQRLIEANWLDNLSGNKLMYINMLANAFNLIKTKHQIQELLQGDDGGDRSGSGDQGDGSGIGSQQENQEVNRILLEKLHFNRQQITDYHKFIENVEQFYGQQIKDNYICPLPLNVQNCQKISKILKNSVTCHGIIEDNLLKILPNTDYKVNKLFPFNSCLFYLEEQPLSQQQKKAMGYQDGGYYSQRQDGGGKGNNPYNQNIYQSQDQQYKQNVQMNYQTAVPYYSQINSSNSLKVREFLGQYIDRSMLEGLKWIYQDMLFRIVLVNVDEQLGLLRQQLPAKKISRQQVALVYLESRQQVDVVTNLIRIKQMMNSLSPTRSRLPKDTPTFKSFFQRVSRVSWKSYYYKSLLPFINQCAQLTEQAKLQQNQQIQASQIFNAEHSLSISLKQQATELGSVIEKPGDMGNGGSLPAASQRQDFNTIIAKPLNDQDEDQKEAIGEEIKGLNTQNAQKQSSLNNNENAGSQEKQAVNLSQGIPSYNQPQQPKQGDLFQSNTSMQKQQQILQTYQEYQDNNMVASNHSEQMRNNNNNIQATQQRIAENPIIGKELINSELIYSDNLKKMAEQQPTEWPNQYLVQLQMQQYQQQQKQKFQEQTNLRTSIDHNQDQQKAPSTLSFGNNQQFSQKNQNNPSMEDQNQYNDDDDYNSIQQETVQAIKQEQGYTEDFEQNEKLTTSQAKFLEQQNRQPPQTINQNMMQQQQQQQPLGTNFTSFANNSPQILSNSNQEYILSHIQNKPAQQQTSTNNFGHPDNRYKLRQLTQQMGGQQQSPEDTPFLQQQQYVSKLREHSASPGRKVGAFLHARNKSVLTHSQMQQQLFLENQQHQKIYVEDDFQQQQIPLYYQEFVEYSDPPFKTVHPNANRKSTLENFNGEGSIANKSERRQSSPGRQQQKPAIVQQPPQSNLLKSMINQSNSNTGRGATSFRDDNQIEFKLLDLEIYSPTVQLSYELQVKLSLISTVVVVGGSNSVGGSAQQQAMRQERINMLQNQICIGVLQQTLENGINQYTFNKDHNTFYVDFQKFFQLEEGVSSLNNGKQGQTETQEVALGIHLFDPVLNIELSQTKVQIEQLVDAEHIGRDNWIVVQMTSRMLQQKSCSHGFLHLQSFFAQRLKGVFASYDEYLFHSFAEQSVFNDNYYCDYFILPQATLSPMLFDLLLDLAHLLDPLWLQRQISFICDLGNGGQSNNQVVYSDNNDKGSRKEEGQTLTKSAICPQLRAPLVRYILHYIFASKMCHFLSVLGRTHELWEEFEKALNQLDTTVSNNNNNNLSGLSISGKNQSNSNNNNSNQLQQKFLQQHQSSSQLFAIREDELEYRRRELYRDYLQLCLEGIPPNLRFYNWQELGGYIHLLQRTCVNLQDYVQQNQSASFFSPNLMKRSDMEQLFKSFMQLQKLNGVSQEQQQQLLLLNNANLMYIICKEEGNYMICDNILQFLEDLSNTHQLYLNGVKQNLQQLVLCCMQRVGRAFYFWCVTSDDLVGFMHHRAIMPIIEKLCILNITTEQELQEDQVFWTLVNLAVNFLQPLYYGGGSVSQGNDLGVKRSETAMRTSRLKQLLFYLNFTVQKYLKDVFDKIQELGGTLEFFFAEPILSLYAGFFNDELLFRLWDLLFIEQQSQNYRADLVLVAAAFTVIRRLAPLIENVQSFQELALLIETYSKFEIDFNGFISAVLDALNICFSFQQTQEQVKGRSVVQQLVITEAILEEKHLYYQNTIRKIQERYILQNASLYHLLLNERISLNILNLYLVIDNIWQYQQKKTQKITYQDKQHTLLTQFQNPPMLSQYGSIVAEQRSITPPNNNATTVRRINLNEVPTYNSRLVDPRQSQYSSPNVDNNLQQQQPLQVGSQQQQQQIAIFIYCFCMNLPEYGNDRMGRPVKRTPTTTNTSGNYNEQLFEMKVIYHNQNRSYSITNQQHIDILTCMDQQQNKAQLKQPQGTSINNNKSAQSRQIVSSFEQQEVRSEEDQEEEIVFFSIFDQKGGAEYVAQLDLELFQHNTIFKYDCPVFEANSQLSSQSELFLFPHEFTLQISVLILNSQGTSLQNNNNLSFQSIREQLQEQQSTPPKQYSQTKGAAQSYQTAPVQLNPQYLLQKPMLPLTFAENFAWFDYFKNWLKAKDQLSQVIDQYTVQTVNGVYYTRKDSILYRERQIQNKLTDIGHVGNTMNPLTLYKLGSAIENRFSDFTQIFGGILLPPNYTDQQQRSPVRISKNQTEPFQQDFLQLFERFSEGHTQLQQQQGFTQNPNNANVQQQYNFFAADLAIAATLAAPGTFEQRGSILFEFLWFFETAQRGGPVEGLKEARIKERHITNQMLHSFMLAFYQRVQLHIPGAAVVNMESAINDGNVPQVNIALYKTLSFGIVDVTDFMREQLVNEIFSKTLHKDFYFDNEDFLELFKNFLLRQKKIVQIQPGDLYVQYSSHRYQIRNLTVYLEVHGNQFHVKKSIGRGSGDGNLRNYYTTTTTSYLPQPQPQSQSQSQPQASTNNPLLNCFANMMSADKSLFSLQTFKKYNEEEFVAFMHRMPMAHFFMACGGPDELALRGIQKLKLFKEKWTTILAHIHINSRHVISVQLCDQKFQHSLLFSQSKQQDVPKQQIAQTIFLPFLSMHIRLDFIIQQLRERLISQSVLTVPQQPPASSSKFFSNNQLEIDLQSINNMDCDVFYQSISSTSRAKQTSVLKLRLDKSLAQQQLRQTSTQSTGTAASVHRSNNSYSLELSFVFFQVQQQGGQSQQYQQLNSGKRKKIFSDKIPQVIGSGGGGQASQCSQKYANYSDYIIVDHKPALLNTLVYDQADDINNAATSSTLQAFNDEEFRQKVELKDYCKFQENGYEIYLPCKVVRRAVQTNQVNQQIVVINQAYMPFIDKSFYFSLNDDQVIRMTGGTTTTDSVVNDATNTKLQQKQ